MMKLRSLPVAFPTSWSFPIRWEIHCLAPAKSVLTLMSPSFPRRLISWSGLATSFCQVKRKPNFNQEAQKCTTYGKQTHNNFLVNLPT